MTQVFLGTEEGRAHIKSLQPLQRVGEPDDIADAVLFLASISRAGWTGGRWRRAARQSLIDRGRL